MLICVVGFLQLTARKVDDTFKIPKYVFPCSVIVLSESKTVKYIDSYMRSWHIYYPVVYLYISYI